MGRASAEAGEYRAELTPYLGQDEDAQDTAGWVKDAIRSFGVPQVAVQVWVNQGACPSASMAWPLEAQAWSAKPACELHGVLSGACGRAGERPAGNPQGVQCVRST
jgi:hypothetical protein